MWDAIAVYLFFVFLGKVTFEVVQSLSASVVKSQVVVDMNNLGVCVLDWVIDISVQWILMAAPTARPWGVVHHLVWILDGVDIRVDYQFWLTANRVSSITWIIVGFHSIESHTLAERLHVSSLTSEASFLFALLAAVVVLQAEIDAS